MKGGGDTTTNPTQASPKSMWETDGLLH